MNLKSGRSVVNIAKIMQRQFCTKRKHPINPDLVNQLPVFEYPISKASYNRIFVWGCTLTGALGTQYKKKQNTQIIESLSYPRRLTFAENHDITAVACGFGFTLLAVKSSSGYQLYGMGLNTDSQIGYHEISRGKPLDVVYFAQPVYLPFQEPTKATISKVSAGRAHTMVLTNEGIFTLGNNAYGQCGRPIVADEKYSGRKFVYQIDKIEDKKIKDIACGQDHSLVITEGGSVYSCGWGADGQTGLEHFDVADSFTKLKGDIASENIVKIASKSDFTLALNDKGEIFGWGNTEYGQLKTNNDVQQVNVPTYIQVSKSVGKVCDIAAGGSFCMALNEDGEVFVWGFGLLGFGPAVQSSTVPRLISSVLFGRNEFQPNSKVQKLVCGVNYMGAITNLGDLYIWGRNKDRCLGLGNEKDQYFPLRVAIGGYVKDVQCGLDHTVALCKPFI